MAKRQFETGYTSRLELMQADSELRSTRAQIRRWRIKLPSRRTPLAC